MSDLADGRFQILIDDIDQPKPAKIKRLCSAPVRSTTTYWKKRGRCADTAIVRVEQLYPFPRADIQAILDRYSDAEEVIWCQEEPRNQGTWFFMLSRRHLAGRSRPNTELRGREYSAPCGRLSECPCRTAATTGSRRARPEQVPNPSVYELTWRSKAVLGEFRQYPRVTGKLTRDY